MNRTIQRMVWKKAERLRVCALLTLVCVAGGMLFQGGAERSEEMAAQTAAKALEGFVVAIDPGHGGYDGGARAHDSGVWEKELTLQIALETEKALTARGAAVILTRREDVCLCKGNTATRARKREDLKARMEIAMNAGADVLLSVHLNEYRKRSENGPQVFYQHGGEDGRLLAGVLQEALVRGLQPKKERVAMAGDYYVLRSRLPSALVECGFLSNAEEEKLLLNRDYHQKIAAALADGLTQYRELLRRVEPDGDGAGAYGER